MPVEINGLNTGHSQSRQKNDIAKATESAAKPTQTSSTQNSGQGDRVSLSAHAKNLHKLESKAASLPDVDSARVDEIKAAIEDGSYQPNAENIAAKMMQLDEQL